jgi:hypothetical protein
MCNRLLPLCAVTILCLPDAFSFAAELSPPAGDRLLQQELKQQQLRVTTQRVGEQLAAIIEEFDRNGIAGEDVEVLRTIRGVLGLLSEKDMQEVIRLLQQARETADGQASNQDVAKAFAGQKGIMIKLEQLLREYQRQHALYELSLRFKELANKQAANMRLSVWLAKLTEGKSPNAFDEGQKLNLQLQQTEQESLKAEVRITVEKLEALAKQVLDGPSADRPKAGLQQVKDGGLLPALDSAVEEITKARLMSAAGNEKRARDQLREIARVLIHSQDPAETLRQALRELEQTIDQQKQVMADTRKVERKEDSTMIETRQAELVDSTDLIRRDVDSIAPSAVEHLRASIDRMQEARGVLSNERDLKKQRDRTPPKQAEALTNMELARRALQEELAKAEEKAAQPENALAALKQLHEEIRELAQEQEKLKAETAAAEQKDLLSKAPKQGELKDKAQELQQKAAPQTPSAAQTIGEAATQMQRAQNSLAGNQNNPAAQQAAIDALNKAAQQLEQELARLEQAQQELALLEELLKRLVAIIERQLKVQLSTAKEAAKPEPSPLQEIAGQQERLGAETGQLQQEASKPVPKAAAHLGNAKDDMAQAKSALDKPAPKVAQPLQSEALADLYLAKREIEEKIEELQHALGIDPSADAQSLADAAALIEKAQQEVNQAMDAMQQAPPGLMESLLAQQQQIADALGPMSQNEPPASPLAKAQQSAGKAAQQLAKTDLPGAVESMKSAQSAMQQAEQAEQKEQKSSGLPDVSKRQAEVQKLAEALLSAQQAVSQSAMQKAGELLEQAGSDISPITAGELGPLPPMAQSALQSAQKDLAEGTSKACSGQCPSAQASAAAAAQSLAQARAALSLAQAGLGSQPGNVPGQGQQPGQGRGKNQGQGQGRGQPGPEGTGRQGNWTGTGGDGTRREGNGLGTFTGLPARDRAAILQSQSEKYPQEYGPLVEQYLKNLSDQAGEK